MKRQGLPAAIFVLLLVLSMGARAEDLPVEARDAIDRGVAAVNRSEWELAIRHFDEAHAAGGNAPPILHDLGQAHANAGHPLAAVAWFHAYLEAAPEAPNALKVRQRANDTELEVEVRVRRMLAQARDLANTLPEERREDILGTLAKLHASAGALQEALNLARQEELLKQVTRYDSEGLPKIRISPVGPSTREWVHANYASHLLLGRDYLGADEAVDRFRNNDDSENGRYDYNDMYLRLELPYLMMAKQLDRLGRPEKARSYARRESSYTWDEANQILAAIGTGCKWDLPEMTPATRKERVQAWVDHARKLLKADVVVNLDARIREASSVKVDAAPMELGKLASELARHLQETRGLIRLLPIQEQVQAKLEEDKKKREYYLSRYKVAGFGEASRQGEPVSDCELLWWSTTYRCGSSGRIEFTAYDGTFFTMGPNCEGWIEGLHGSAPEPRFDPSVWRGNARFITGPDGPALIGVKNRIGVDDVEVEESPESPRGIRVMELPGWWVGVHGASDFIVQVSQEDWYSFHVEVLEGRIAVTNKKDGSLVGIDRGEHVVFSGGKVIETKKVPPAEMERNWASLTGQPPRQRQTPALVSGNGHIAWWGVAGGGLVVIVLAFLAFRRIRPTPRGSG